MRKTIRGISNHKWLAPVGRQGGREIYLEHLTPIHKLVKLCAKVYLKSPSSAQKQGYEYMHTLKYIFDQPDYPHHERHKLFGGKFLRSN